MFFCRINVLCWFLFRYPFHPRVTAVARKRARSICQKRRWWVTCSERRMPRHPTYVTLHEVMWHGAWLYGVRRTHQDGSSFTWHQPCNNQTVLYVHHFGSYSKRAVKSYSHSFRITWDKNLITYLPSASLPPSFPPYLPTSLSLPLSLLPSLSPSLSLSLPLSLPLSLVWGIEFCCVCHQGQTCAQIFILV